MSLGTFTANIAGSQPKDGLPSVAIGQPATITITQAGGSTGLVYLRSDKAGIFGAQWPQINANSTLSVGYTPLAGGTHTIEIYALVSNQNLNPQPVVKQPTDAFVQTFGTDIGLLAMTAVQAFGATAQVVATGSQLGNGVAPVIGASPASYATPFGKWDIKYPGLV